jgi:hypothetical protein
MDHSQEMVGIADRPADQTTPAPGR